MAWKRKRPDLWKKNKVCPNCGAPTNPEIYACETGCDYCSSDCAEEHVKSLERFKRW